LSSGFISQQDGARAYTAVLAQDWIATNCNEFIGKDEWPVGHQSRQTLTLLMSRLGSFA